MAKRFTDTEKWKRPWYRKLPPRLREFWNYVQDNCDFAGVWDVDFELASFFIGETIEEISVKEAFGDRLVFLPGERVFIPSFIELQYGELTTDSKPHQGVIKRLTQLGLWNELNQRVSLPLVDSPKGLPKGYLTPKDKEKEKEEDQEGEGGTGEGEKIAETCVINNAGFQNVPVEFEPTFAEFAKEQISEAITLTHPPPKRFDFEKIYADYPRKEGKAEGILACKAQIKTLADYEALKSAIGRYREHCEKDRTECGFIKHFSTFMNKGRWRDWLDPETGTGPNGHGGSFDIGKILEARGLDEFGRVQPTNE